VYLNNLIGSAEAFKAIGNAVAVLTDAEKRKSYDLYGKDERVNNIRRSNSFNQYSGFRQEYAYARGFESEFTAEELFNMFFGGGFPAQAAQTRYRRYQHHHEDQTVIHNFFINIISLIGFFYYL
jgi:DnaJ homolog subfamily B member 12